MPSFKSFREEDRVNTQILGELYFTFNKSIKEPRRYKLAGLCSKWTSMAWPSSMEGKFIILVKHVPGVAGAVPVVVVQSWLDVVGVDSYVSS